MVYAIPVPESKTTTTATTIILNTGYFKTRPGILKLLELLWGVVCVVLFAYYSDRHYYVPLNSPETFLLDTFITFTTGTFIIVISCLMSVSTASLMSKTLYEVLFHGFACVMCFIAALRMLIVMHVYLSDYHLEYGSHWGAVLMGLVLAALYLWSTILAVRSYRETESSFPCYPSSPDEKK